MSDTKPPRNDLYRAMPGGVLSDDGKSLTVRLAPHDQWAEIHEAGGHFMERFAKSAYKRSMNNQKPKILFQHGQDPVIGDKPIATTDEVGEDSTSPYVRGRLLEGVPELVVDGIREGVYGASHRFSVVREDWVDHPLGGTHNPDKLPERTITEARLFELGPVTWPAYAGASVGLRSMTVADFIPTEPVAPSDAPAAQPHPVDEARDEPDVIAAPTSRSMNMDGPILSIEDKRARVTELNDSLQRTAESIPGALPEDEQVRWNTDVDERDRLAADIKAYDERMAQIAVALSEGRVERYAPPVNRNVIIRKSEAELHSPETRATSYEGAMAEYRDDAMHLLEKTKFAYGLADQTASGDRVTDLLTYHDSPDKELARRIKCSSSPAYVSAFHKFITSRGTMGFTPEEQRGTALAVGVDGTGGFMVPFAFDPTVIAIGVNSGAVNPYRRACRVVSIVGTDTWNALTATVVVATRTTEAAAATEQGPTFAQPQYIVTRVQGQITASFEMFQDRADLASELSGLIQEAKDNEEESSMATGATAAANIGVGPVSGTSGAYTAVASTAGAGVLAAADFLATEAALPVRHRFNAQWFMNRLNIRKAQALETTGGQLFGGSQYPSVGNPVTDGAGNTGLRLLGYPVNESPSLPVATTTTITAATLANVSSYVIVDRIGLAVQFIPFIFNSSALATGQQALYFMYRNTAKPINVDAGRTLRFQ